MKYTACLLSLFVVLAFPAENARAQAGGEPDATYRSVSSAKAFGLSLVIPGLGHRYVHQGDWGGWASVFAVADAGLWAGLVGSGWRRGHLTRSYRTLAARHAGVDTEGKGRSFYLNVAAYPSSDAFTEAQLRDRTWDRVDYAADPSFQWEWDSQENFLLFRELREDAESLRRRRSFLVAALVANRLIAGVTSIRAARRAAAPNAHLSLDVPPAGSSFPLVRLDYRF